MLIHKVIHTYPREKWHKIDFSTELSTLSTEIGGENVDYFMYKKNKRFVDI